MTKPDMSPQSHDLDPGLFPGLIPPTPPVVEEWKPGKPLVDNVAEVAAEKIESRGGEGVHAETTGTGMAVLDEVEEGVRRSSDDLQAAVKSVPTGHWASSPRVQTLNEVQRKASRRPSQWARNEAASIVRHYEQPWNADNLPTDQDGASARRGGAAARAIVDLTIAQNRKKQNKKG